jgi:hypothetical protein
MFMESDKFIVEAALNRRTVPRKKSTNLLVVRHRKLRKKMD